MKIAILTLPLHTNYGGILQCYALQIVLERMGHDVQVLTKPKYGRSYYWIYPLAICKRLLKRFVLRKNVLIWKAPHEFFSKYTDRFIYQYIHRLIKRRWTSKIANRFDAIVVGSDQVWRPEYLGGIPLEDAFLNFAKSCAIKRIAYAASFGVDECTYTPEQLKHCAPLLQLFDAVSVREFSGIGICKKYFGVEACQKIDPTMLLNAKDYMQLVSQTDTKPSHGDLMVYVLDETDEKEKIVNAVSVAERLSPFGANSKVENPTAPLEERIQPPVEQWLRGFHDASMVVTDSFHGCVFSILFRKPFIAIGNAERGMARFTSLLHTFGLENRLIHSWKEYLERVDELLEPIDYVVVYQKLQICREEAMQFFHHAFA